MQISALNAAALQGVPRHRPRAAASEAAADTVSLSPEPNARPANPAARSGLGALGPVVEGELAQLHLKFAEKKWLRLWGPDTKPLSAEQAAGRLESGKASRLLVEIGGKQLPLQDKTDLAALEHLSGQSLREAPATAQALKNLADGGHTFEGLGNYEAYLVSKAGQSLVVLQSETPCLRVTPQELVEPSLPARVASCERVWSDAAQRLETDPAGATAAAVRHLAQVYPGQADRIAAQIPAGPMRALTSHMLKELAPDAVADRLELAAPPLPGSTPLERAEALQKFGWASELTGLQAADKALRFQTREVGWNQARERMEQVAALKRPELVAQFATSTPDPGVLARAIEDRLPHSEPQAALKARSSPHQAFLEVSRLADTLTESKQSWYGHSQPLLRAYARHKPDAEALEFLHEAARKGIVGDEAAQALQAVLTPVGNLSQTDRIRFFRELTMQDHKAMAQTTVRLSVYTAWAEEVKAGATPEAAAKHVTEIGDQLVKQNQTWYGYAGPSFQALGRYAAADDDKRAFLLELIEHGVSGDQANACLALVVKPVAQTTLKERAQGFRDVCLAKTPLADAGAREAAVRAWRADVAAGTTPAEATARLQALGEDLTKRGVTWYGYVQGALSSYETYLAGSDAERTQRQGFMASLMERQILGDELRGACDQVFPPVGNTTVNERVAAFDRLAGTKPFSTGNCRVPAMAAWRAEVAAGTPSDRALTRLTQVAGALEKAKVEWYGYVTPVLEGYADHLAGGDELDPGRAFLGRLIGNGVYGDEACSVLGTLLEPTSGATLDEKSQAFEQLAYGKDTLYAGGLRGSLAEALQSQVACGVPVEEARQSLESLATAAKAAKYTWSGYVSGMLTGCADNLQSPLAQRTGYAMLTAELGHGKPQNTRLDKIPLRLGEVMEELSELGLTDAELGTLLQGATLESLDSVVETARQASALARRPENAAAVGEGEGHVVFQGVRVAKRGAHVESDGPELTEGEASAPVPETVELAPVPVPKSTRPADDLEFAYQSARLGQMFDQNNSTSSRAVFSAVLAVAGDEEKAREAYQLGGRFDQNNSRSSRAAYSVAAAAAGDPDRARQAYRLGTEFDQGNSHASRSLYTLAAALAGDRKRARQAYADGTALDNGNSHRTRAFFTVAAAIAGPNIGVAAALGSQFDRNNSTRSRSLFTVACAIAGDTASAEAAHDLATEFDRNNSTASRAMFTIACAIAGTEERARKAHELAGELDRNNSTKSRAMYTIACAAALNPERARLAIPINYDYIWDDD